VPEDTTSAGAGLERSCRDHTYAVGVTDRGVQVFDYRGAVRASRPGQVVVLHPDEAHDGRAGTPEGFGYRIVYVEPARLAEAVRALRGRPGPLPFVREPVATNARLARAIDGAFRAPLEPLAADGLIVELAEGLLAAESRVAGPTASRRVDVAAVERARRFLETERTRVVRSSELEALTGLTRYDLARQFRILLGTSPYRYLLMRRLELARDRIRDGCPLAAVAGDAGFADQAHFTRAFKSAFGLTPARYRALRAARRP
jgi:AraC-like DNA-binding protein